MPKVLPGVNVTTEDLSDVIQLNTSLIGAAIGEFAYGDDEEIQLITSKEDFKLLCGDIANAPNKKSWMSVYKVLEDAEGVQVLNVTKNAKYGGLFLTNRGTKQFPAGISTRDIDAFNFRILVSDEIVDSGDGSTLSFTTGRLAHPTVYANSAILTFTTGGNEISVTGVTVSGITTFTNVTYLSSATLDNITGEVSVVFQSGKAPDDGTDITMTYRKDYDDYIISNAELGDGSTLSFSGTLTDLPITTGKTVLEFTNTGSVITVNGTDNGDGTDIFTNGTYLTSAVVNRTTGEYTIVFKAGKAPDDGTYINLKYHQPVYPLAALIARSKKSWSDDIGIKTYNVDTTYEEITLYEYKKDSNSNDVYVNSYIVSLDSDAISGSGKAIFIEDIFTNESNLFYAIANTDTAIPASTLPPVETTITYADGGDDGDAVTDTERATAIQAFSNPDVSWDYFCGAGITSKTLIDEVVAIVYDADENAYKFAFMDTIDGSYSTIVSWMNSTVNLDNMRMYFLAPDAYVSYNGKEYLCAASGLALKQKARVNASGNPFMPPVGLGENRGSVNVVRLVRYFKNAEIRELHAANVNVIKKIKGQGIAIFSDFTAQKRVSSTSYVNSVLTLNNMQTTFASALQVIDFKIINQDTFNYLRVLIESYLRLLELYDGTIEPGSWTLKIEELNNATTKDARKIYAQLIFVFQTLAQEVNLKLTYTSNSVYQELVG